MADVDNSDHNAVIVEVDCNVNKAHSIKKKIVLYNQVDFDCMHQFFEKNIT